MAKQTVDIGMIAETVGLSRTTVSYVLNGKYQHMKISDQTAQKILKTADKLGYRSNFWAKSLANQRTRLIGVLFPDISGSAAHQIMEGIQEVLEEKEYEAILAVSFWKQQREIKEIELMLEKRVEGILALPQARSDQTFNTAIKAGCPVVFLCDWLPDLNASSVTLDTQDAIEKNIDHLYKLGRKNIKLLAVDYASKTLIEREEAFKKGLSKRGLRMGPKSVIYTELANIESVYTQVRKMMNAPDKPDALVCISDAIALSALSELARMKVRIPDELAVAGIGNLQLTDHPFFSLTTVDECRREIGQQAARLILRKIDQNIADPVRPEHIRVKGELIVRPSTVGGQQIHTSIS